MLDEEKLDGFSFIVKLLEFYNKPVNDKNIECIIECVNDIKSLD